MKIYRYYGINTAIDLLRPGAKWEWTAGIGFTAWDDERPQPSAEEVFDTMEKIKSFEDSFETIWTNDQKAMFEKLQEIPYLRCNDGFHLLKHYKSDQVYVKDNGILIDEHYDLAAQIQKEDNL